MPKIFAIADLHLPGGLGKTMDLFGAEWKNHDQKIENNWQEMVHPEDLVLVAGDISWAMKLGQAKEDLDRIGKWPGRKVLVKGNHDYWWSGIGKVRKALAENTFAIQNDYFAFEEVVICGTRGWICPNQEMFTADDEKIYLRELQRFELSLKAVPVPGEKIIAMLHFPPFNDQGVPSGFVELMRRYGVFKCIYGHLHGESQENAVTGNVGGIEYHLAAVDYLDFKPLELMSLP